MMELMETVSGHPVDRNCCHYHTAASLHGAVHLCSTPFHSECPWTLDRMRWCQRRGEAWPVLCRGSHLQGVENRFLPLFFGSTAHVCGWVVCGFGGVFLLVTISQRGSNPSRTAGDGTPLLCITAVSAQRVIENPSLLSILSKPNFIDF